jgi:methionyl aminopeptidase
MRLEPGYKYQQGREYSIFKDEKELLKFRKACMIAAEAVRRAVEGVKVGVSTDDIDKIVHDYIISQNAYPSPIKYMGFPKSVCTSVNEGKIH